MLFNMDKKKIIKKYLNLLSNEQKERYYKISKERRDIYLKGFLLGIVLSLVVLFKFKKLFNNKAKLLCIVVSISSFVNYFYYIIHPKSDYMIIHLENKNKRIAWLNIYKHMQKYYHTSLILGLLFTITFFHSLCK